MVRCLLINHYLRLGRDQAALVVCNSFEQDTMPEVLYGRVLALYRLRQQSEAGLALRRAHETLPNVWAYLTGKMRRKPRVDEDLAAQGSVAQAWTYRQSMLPTWRSVKGLIPWLRRTITT